MIFTAYLFRRIELIFNCGPVDGSGGIPRFGRYLFGLTVGVVVGPIFNCSDITRMNLVVGRRANEICLELRISD